MEIKSFNKCFFLFFVNVFNLQEIALYELLSIKWLSIPQKKLNWPFTLLEHFLSLVVCKLIHNAIPPWNDILSLYIIK